ncbi:MAG: hypothetical protein AAGB51_12400 [Planctomycetota bacterium]
MADGQAITDTAAYPAYTAKATLMVDLYHLIDSPSEEDIREFYFRLGNTDFSSVSNPTFTVAQTEAAIV